jgi:hypothetical protein
VAPGNLVYPLVDRAMKAADVQSAGHIVERDFGLMELHAAGPAAVRAAGDAVLAQLGMTPEQALSPEMVSSQILSNVTDYHSQLFNVVRRGAWTLPGDSLFVMEVAPAAYIYRLANELEKAVGVALVRVAGTGVYGRLIVAGSDSEVALAAELSPSILAGQHGPVMASGGG